MTYQYRLNPTPEQASTMEFWGELLRRQRLGGEDVTIHDPYREAMLKAHLFQGWDENEQAYS